jgi:hypothetical protein
MVCSKFQNIYRAISFLINLNFMEALLNVFIMGVCKIIAKSDFSLRHILCLSACMCGLRWMSFHEMLFEIFTVVCRFC